MEEIIKVKNSSYTLYEELLLKKEQVQKDASNYLIQYTVKFGKLIIECYKLKVSCIKKKKMISYCQQKLNHNEKIMQSDLDMYIEETMKSYYDTLSKMNEDYLNSKNTTPISLYEAHQIKSIYRKIAKQIHPDSHPDIKFDDKLKDLWNRVNTAYKCNNLEELIELDVLIQKHLNGKILNEIEIDNIEEKIKKLEEKINYIISNIPYTYKDILNNPETIKDKEKELNNEIQAYQNYAKELDDILATFKIERMMS